MDTEQRQNVVLMLAKGYAQKTIARQCHVTVKDVRSLAHAFGIGRKPGETREKAAKKTMKTETFSSMVDRFMR